MLVNIDLLHILHLPLPHFRMVIQSLVNNNFVEPPQGKQIIALYAHFI